MTKHQLEAANLLFDLVSSLEPRLGPLAGWYSQLVHTIDKWELSEGNQGVKRAKDCLSQAWLAILGEKTSELPFTKASRGLPVIVQPFVDRVLSLKKDARLLSAALSLVRVTDLWLGQPTDKTVSASLEVIQASRLPPTAKRVIDDFESFIPVFFAEYPNSPFSKAWYSPLRIRESHVALWRESKGPNGPLTASSHLDVKTLNESPTADGGTLLEASRSLAEQVAELAMDSFEINPRFPQAVINWKGYDLMKANPCPGKLSFKQEKSGKVRVVAQPDYWTQYAMHPLHDWLTSVHTAFPADCTRDQRSAVPKLSRWTCEGDEVSSFDQTSCTDLFPLEFQLKILSKKFGQSLAETVRTVMVDRDWSVTMPSGVVRKVRWSVGQPLGMFGSWPLMALSHHLLVQYASWISNGRRFTKKPFDRYVICGDDVVIAKPSVADSYRKVAKLLGMKVNLAKSHISGGATGVDPVAEFAKITVWKGQPLTPIRPNMVLAAVRDWRQVVPLFSDLALRSEFRPKLKFLRKMIRKHFASRRKFLEPLLTVPAELGGCGYRDSTPLRGVIQRVRTNQIHPYLYFIADRVRSGLLLENLAYAPIYRDLNLVEGDDPEAVDLLRNHPTTAWVRHWGETHPYIPIFFKERVPTTRQIALELVESGLRSYDRFLTCAGDGPPPFGATDDAKRMQQLRTSWMKAYSKDHFFPREPKVLTQCFSEQSSRETPGYSSDVPMSQYRIIADVLLARRSIA